MLIWTQDNASDRNNPEVLASPLRAPLILAADIATGTGSAGPQLVPAENGVAALLVPAESSRRVTRNGAALLSGVHVLRHTDRIEYAGRVYWVAAVQEVVAVPYDPAVHRDEQHCYITKRRLIAGEMIISCPGRPGAACEAIYQQAAWEMALQSNTRFRCPRCRFEPGATEWRPDVSAPSGLSHLLALAGGQLGGGRR